MPLYNSDAYWNSRYYDEIDYFDWYCTYGDMKNEIKSILNRLSVTFGAMIIEMIDFGCGTSQISENIIRQCPKAKILAIDVSADCIKFMNYNNKATNIEYQCKKISNYSQSKLNRRRYHFIFDKGTTDSILCGVNGEVKMKNIINGDIYNLLCLNGIYLLISHNPNRYRLFAKSKWAIHRKQVKIPYFGPKHSIHYRLTNDIKKYLDENNRILSNYKPFQQADESQNYLQSIIEQKEKENEKKQEKKVKPEPKVIEKPVFNLEKKTAEQLLEERRKRRLEYEASLAAAQKESEKFRKDWEEKQRLKREEKKRKEEEEKNRKIVIKVDEILKKNEEEKQTKDESEESDSYGGYMTDSSEEDSEKEKERIAAIAKLIEDCDDEKQEKAKKKKKKKNKNKAGSGGKKQEMIDYEANLTIYQRFRSKYTLLADVEQNHEPFCFSDPNGRNQKMIEKYQQLMINEFCRQREEAHETTKIIYLYIATKLFNKNSK